MIELYTAGTFNGQRAAIAVNECGLSCRMRPLNLMSGEHQTPEYRKLNPSARIPTLIDPDGPGGTPLTLSQSWAILFYLAEKTGKLIPRDALARVRMMQWLMEGASDMGPTATNIFFLGNRMPEKVPDSTIKFYENRLVDLFRLADTQLASTPYLAGSELSLADLAIYPIYARQKAIIDAAGLKNVAIWAESLAQRPSVQKGMKLEN
jgi:GSH-dependent disulfide-bond oxidoreductase